MARVQKKKERKREKQEKIKADNIPLHLQSSQWQGECLAGREGTEKKESGKGEDKKPVGRGQAQL